MGKLILQEARWTMNGKMRFVFALLLFVSVLGGAIKARADCTQQSGSGSNGECVAGATCGSAGACGVSADYSWCITVTCQTANGCISNFVNYTGCNVGGCVNPFTGNCTCTKIPKGQ